MFRPFIAASAALALIATPAMADDHTGDQAEKEMTKGEAKLAKLLEGRVAGEPERCIRTIGQRNITQIDDTALVYKSGKTIWVNYTRNPESIDDSEVMVIKRFDASNLCRTDQITLVSRTGGFLSGILFLDDFIPYRLPEEEKGG